MPGFWRGWPVVGHRSEDKVREVIYYPGFEVANRDWLKFALLYLDKLDPIIPFTGDPYLSEQFRRLVSETDLISIHRPDAAEGRSATLDALDSVERVLRNPGRYKPVFGTADITQKWKDPRKQTATLFREKFTDAWESFCVARKLGRRTDDGLLIAADVALLYMTLLAQIIAD